MFKFFILVILVSNSFLIMPFASAQYYSNNMGDVMFGNFGISSTLTDSFGSATSIGSINVPSFSYSEPSYTSPSSSNPDYATQQYNQGIDFLSSGSYQDAYDSFTNALNQEPDWYNAAYAKAFTAYEFGNYERAIEDAHYALDLFSKDEAINLLAVSYLKSGQPGYASQYAHELISRGGTHPNAHKIFYTSFFMTTLELSNEEVESVKQQVLSGSVELSEAEALYAATLLSLRLFQYVEAKEYYDKWESSSKTTLNGNWVFSDVLNIGPIVNWSSSFFKYNPPSTARSTFEHPTKEFSVTYFENWHTRPVQFPHMLSLADKEDLPYVTLDAFLFEDVKPFPPEISNEILIDKIAEIFNNNCDNDPNCVNYEFFKTAEVENGNLELEYHGTPIEIPVQKYQMGYHATYIDVDRFGVLPFGVGTGGEVMFLNLMNDSWLIIDEVTMELLNPGNVASGALNVGGFVQSDLLNAILEYYIQSGELQVDSSKYNTGGHVSVSDEGKTQNDDSVAQSLDIQTDKSTYGPGDTVMLSGSTAGAQSIAIEVKDSSGQTIMIRTASPDSQGNFALNFKIPSNAESGPLQISTSANIDGELVQQTENIQVSDSESEAQPVQQSVDKPDNGGCLIATAAFGTELSPQVQFLREVRDSTVMSTSSGAAFMESFNTLYYSFSPAIADYQRQNPVFQEAVRLFITPMISTLSIMTLAEQDSEASVLAAGISVIMLNVGMYVGVPVYGIMKLRQYNSKKNLY